MRESPSALTDRCSIDPRQPGLRQHQPHDAVVDVQLTRDGAHRPLLGVIEAQDLCLDVKRRHHVGVPSGWVALQPVSAMTAAAQEPLTNTIAGLADVARATGAGSGPSVVIGT